MFTQLLKYIITMSFIGIIKGVFAPDNGLIFCWYSFTKPIFFRILTITSNLNENGIQIGECSSIGIKHDQTRQRKFTNFHFVRIKSCKFFTPTMKLLLIYVLIAAAIFTQVFTLGKYWLIFNNHTIFVDLMFWINFFYCPTLEAKKTCLVNGKPMSSYGCKAYCKNTNFPVGICKGQFCFCFEESTWL